MPVPFATAAIDTTGDGLPNTTVTSVDLNLDGIPDVLQVLQAIPFQPLTLAKSQGPFGCPRVPPLRLPQLRTPRLHTPRLISAQLQDR